MPDTDPATAADAAEPADPAASVAPDVEEAQLIAGLAKVVDTARRPLLEEIQPSPHRALDLVLLDMDGTLVDGMSSWEFIHDHFGVSNEENWERYQRGEITDEEFMRSDIGLWTAKADLVHIGEIIGALSRAPLMEGARELVDWCRERDIATCILSGGLELLAERVAKDLGIDMYVANAIHTDTDGYLTGESTPYVRINDKTTPTRALLDALGVPGERAAAIGNSRWDVQMFQQCGLGIAFNPHDDDVREGGDVVIEERDMRLCLPHLERYAQGESGA